MGNELQERFNRMKTQQESQENMMDIEEKIKLNRENASKSFQARQDSEAQLLAQLSGRSPSEFKPRTPTSPKAETSEKGDTGDNDTTDLDTAGGHQLLSAETDMPGPPDPPTGDGGENAKKERTVFDDVASIDSNDTTAGSTSAPADNYYAAPMEGGRDAEGDELSASHSVQQEKADRSGEDVFPLIEHSEKPTMCCFCF